MPVVDMSLELLEKYMGTNPVPADFDEYWSKALAELDCVDAQLEIVKSEYCFTNADCFDLYYTGVRGARIHAKYARPKNITAPAPAVLIFHGYLGSSGNFADLLTYAGQGFCTFAMDCRGQGGTSQDVGGVDGNTTTGHIIRGLNNDDPQDMLFRQIFLDTAQIARLAAQMDEVDSENMCTVGVSQGGALSLVCSALYPNIKRTVSVYPYLCDYKRVWEMQLDANAYADLRYYFRYFDPQHKREDAIFEKLGYIDVANIVRYIKSDVKFFTGLSDTICPPSTQFAAYNHLNTTKEMFIFPDYGHEWLPDCADIGLNFFCKK